jgi:glycosyltransferase involved in cell wall biosynthesis
MKIVVTGTRGIPNILGGVETHCEELFPRIAAQGNDIVLIRRSCYVADDNKIDEYKGIQLIDIPTPKQKSLEAIIHTLRAVIKARSLKPDLIHIHAIGPALLTPVARMLGMKVVVTHHGFDYDRAKWGKLAKFVLRLGERMGATYANRVIVISKNIEDTLHQKYPKIKTSLIFNGVPTADITTKDGYLQTLGLERHKYIVAVGRFVPEKNFHQLIDAFKAANIDGIKLAIAGDADHENEYSLKLKDKAREAGVVLTGFIKGEKLQQLLSGAALFVLPSSHEGLPISLLEAMSYNIDVLASDIPANTIPELTPNDFFHVGDIDDLRDTLIRKFKNHATPRNYNLSNYNWDVIANQTIQVYKEIII